MLRRLTALSLRRPRVVIFSWIIVMIVGFGAAGVLFSSLDGDLDSPESFESEQVWSRLYDLAPWGSSIAAIVEGADVPDTTIQALEAVPGVASVQSGPSG